MSNLKFEFEGTTYEVPCLPEKDWSEWMLGTVKCEGYGCKAICTGRCIYSNVNIAARKAFYYQCFPEEIPVEVEKSCKECANYSPKEEPKKEFPKLTKEVFDREDCPKWANWAAVDASGKAAWYECRPKLESNIWNTGLGEKYKWLCRGSSIIPSVFDASDWEHSLIERDKTIFCSTVSWPTWFKYSKTAGKYYVMRSAEKYFIVGTVLAVEEVPYDVVDVRPFFKYPAALVGEKVRALWSEDHEVSMVIAASNRGVTLGGESEERSISSFILSFASCKCIPLCSFKEV